MPGTLIQINRSSGGIPKRPALGPVPVTRAGLEGDDHRNLKYHGGPDKAILMVAVEVLDDLKTKGFPVFPGAIGENLTVTGLDPGNWRSGQRYRIGDEVVIELTTLRTPCANLDVYNPGIKATLYDAKCKAGNPETPNWARGGFYARVIHEGLLVPGAPVTLESESCRLSNPVMRPDNPPEHPLRQDLPQRSRSLLMPVRHRHPFRRNPRH